MKNFSLAFFFLVMVTAGAAQTTATNPVFIANPYLQVGYSPSANALQLLWITTDTDAEWKVEYKKGKNAAWQKVGEIVFKKIAVANIPAHRVYQSTLADLVLGSVFDYRVSKNNTVVFSTSAHAPKSKDQAYRFVVFGDVGAGTKEAKEIAMGIYNAKADLVLIPGDIVYNNGLVSEYNKRFWPIYNTTTVDTAGVPLMSSIPFVAAVGNHDLVTRNLDRYPDALGYYHYWQQPLNGPAGKEGVVYPALTGTDENKKAFLESAGKAYPAMANFSYDYGNAHWLVIDADNYVDWTDKELTDWVAQDLANAKDAQWRFVMYHQPGFNSSRAHYEQQQMRLLSPVFEEGKVDVVFTGHVHNYQRSYPLKFRSDNKTGNQLVSGPNKTFAGKIVTGAWTLDKTYNGVDKTKPNGIIYLVSGAGGQGLYNKEQQNDKDSWQGFTTKFISKVHSFTVADVKGKTLTIKQLSADGKEVDSFVITKD
jgi:hypothetical protein